MQVKQLSSVHLSSKQECRMQVSQLMYRLNNDSDADSGSKLQSDTDAGALKHLPPVHFRQRCRHLSHHVQSLSLQQCTILLDVVIHFRRSC